jgi:hypothetical protein
VDGKTIFISSPSILIHPIENNKFQGEYDDVVYFDLTHSSNFKCNIYELTQSRLLINLKTLLIIHDNESCNSLTCKQEHILNSLSFNFSQLLVIRSLTSHGYISYSKNLLFGNMPIALSSQLQFPRFLNERHLTKSTGIIICCDTFKGVQVTENFIKSWQGPSVLILISNTPSLNYHIDINRTKSKVDLALHFKAICDLKNNSGHLVCILSYYNSSLVSLFPTGSLSFVYLDNFQSNDDFFKSLIEWHKRLVLNGLILGSRLTQFDSSRNNNNEVSKTSFDYVDVNIFPLIEMFCYSIDRNFLATFDETNHLFCNNSFNLHNQHFLSI